tara:strand:- start:16274 stop:17041 length:768 start_codon:yes stop_codon:yes gene_type:complete
MCNGGGHNYSNDSYQPVGLRNYAKIFLGWSGGSDALETDRKNALGNHLGSYDLSGSYKFKNWTLSNYWQFLWEDSSGLTPFNWRDGLMGISVKSNIQESPINTINIEIIRTNDQGALKLDEDGNQFVEPDDFFNNSVYGSGWSYNNRVIGNPIFLINKDPASERNIIDNMINGFSLGVAGQINNLKYQTSYRWFKNQGTYTDRLSEPYTLSSISSKIELKYSKSSFGFILMYEWGKERPEGNTGLQLSYSRQFSF